MGDDGGGGGDCGGGDCGGGGDTGGDCGGGGDTGGDCHTGYADCSSWADADTDTAHHTAGHHASDIYPHHGTLYDGNGSSWSHPLTNDSTFESSQRTNGRSNNRGMANKRPRNHRNAKINACLIACMIATILAFAGIIIFVATIHYHSN